jgi:hypothetical protein
MTYPEPSRFLRTAATSPIASEAEPPNSQADLASRIAVGLAPIMGTLGPDQHEHVARWAARIVQRTGPGPYPPMVMNDASIAACYHAPPGVSSFQQVAATEVVARVMGVTCAGPRASIAHMLGQDLFVVMLRMPRPFERRS